jgi:hypothetical protein
MVSVASRCGAASYETNAHTHTPNKAKQNPYKPMPYPHARSINRPRLPETDANGRRRRRRSTRAATHHGRNRCAIGEVRGLMHEPRSTMPARRDAAKEGVRACSLQLTCIDRDKTHTTSIFVATSFPLHPGVTQVCASYVQPEHSKQAVSELLYRPETKRSSRVHWVLLAKDCDRLRK